MMKPTECPLVGRNIAPRGSFGFGSTVPPM